MLEKIKSNSLSVLHIATYADDVCDDFNDFLEALQSNTSIETVHLEKEFIGDLRSEGRENLLKSLGKMKQLKELTLADGLLQISHVSQLVQSATSLRTLRLKNLVLQGIDFDFDSCEAALYQNPGIKEFELENCSPALEHISIDKLNVASQKFATGTIGNPTLNSKNAMTA